MGPRTIGMAGAMGVLAAGLVSGLLAAPGDAATGERERGPRWQPAGETIVAVEGDADNGFTIHHHDGTTLSPPTLSESTAECSEYDTEVQVVACQVETETWFRDLAATRAAIAWARYDASRPRPGT
ncbi:hypothetical protein ASE01_06735 [Nocardioides sp. Root190]|uniref:hypothetical protein n=1 Tax=Nocardioides sp. Root190 TaxID=1736488 RepID=UPI0006F6AC1F|nr:hypothetical protein [Nocardioides sp. Root190]KRB77875.1 hypothetical protein ASE01_06735 [Nocardioides sp. Root190]